MLTIQPSMSDRYSKAQNFGWNPRRYDDAEYVDYEEIFDDPRQGSTVKSQYFDIEAERQKAAQEYDLWQETKHNIDTIARTTESVPVINKGMKIFSGLISIAVGWGGLRWGTVGTLKVMNDLGKTTPVKFVRNMTKDSCESISNWYSAGKKFLNKQDWVVDLKLQKAGIKKAFLESSIGNKYTSIKNAIKSNSLYQRSVEMVDNAIKTIKGLNPKRIFVETMGVAGGGTAALNSVGAQAIDGNRHDIQQINDDVYVIDGRYGLDYRRNRGSRYGY